VELAFRILEDADQLSPRGGHPRPDKHQPAWVYQHHSTVILLVTTLLGK
jgi:hypothetical protein